MSGEEDDFIYESGEPVATGGHGEHDYVYANGVPVTDTGQSTYVFESGVGLGGAGLIIDDFEEYSSDAELYNAYTGESGFQVDSGRTYHGEQALFTNTTNNITIRSDEGEGLNHYPRRGERIRWHDYKTNDTRRMEFYWGVQDIGGGSGTGANDGDGYALIWYGTNIGGREEEIRFIRYDDGAETILDSTVRTIPLNEWITYTVDYDIDGNGRMECKIEDSNGEETLSAVDTTHAYRGIGWGSGATGGNQWFDFARVVA